MSDFNIALLASRIEDYLKAFRLGVELPKNLIINILFNEIVDLDINNVT